MALRQLAQRGLLCIKRGGKKEGSLGRRHVDKPGKAGMQKGPYKRQRIEKFKNIYIKQKKIGQDDTWHYVVTEALFV